MCPDFELFPVSVQEQGDQQRRVHLLLQEINEAAD